MNTRACSILIAVLFLASSAFAGQATTTSPETKKRMLTLITQLENDPYAKDAKKTRAEVLKWIADAPDVTVSLCTRVLGDLDAFRSDDGSILVGQQMYSEAKFILEHPAQAEDHQAVKRAGLDGVLRTYERMKAAKPATKVDGAEKLAALKANGTLDAHIAQAIAECQNK